VGGDTHSEGLPVQTASGQKDGGKVLLSGKAYPKKYIKRHELYPAKIVNQRQNNELLPGMAVWPLNGSISARLYVLTFRRK
jgi:hypothetical protein